MDFWIEIHLRRELKTCRLQRGCILNPASFTCLSTALFHAIFAAVIYSCSDIHTSASPVIHWTGEGFQGEIASLFKKIIFHADRAPGSRSGRWGLNGQPSEKNQKRNECSGCSVPERIHLLLLSVLSRSTRSQFPSGAFPDGPPAAPGVAAPRRCRAPTSRRS